jgi:hypothetical protein
LEKQRKNREKKQVRQQNKKKKGKKNKDSKKNVSSDVRIDERKSVKCRQPVPLRTACRTFGVHVAILHSSVVRPLGCMGLTHDLLSGFYRPKIPR